MSGTQPTVITPPAERPDVLLATKLHVPRIHPGFVPRPQLVQAVSEGPARGLVLVCAPAGFGKTALLADWASGGGRAVAWLSLDAGDNDPTRFWRYALAALDLARPGIAERVGPLLGPPPPRSFEGLVTALDLGTVRDQRAYLVRISTRQALSRLRTLARRKESYVGPWLPEPLLTAPDVAEDVELADSVSMAMLLVLETLTPAERAVFVLREVFDVAYDEIAEAVGKSPAAVRQIARRARAHVATRRPRAVVSPAQARNALETFQRAVETGDLQSLVHILAPDVVFLGDGGGVVPAALVPVVGADPVARVMVRIDPAASLQAAQVNGYPALIIRLNGQIDTVVAVSMDNGLITGLYAVRNPQKLSHMDREAALRR